jgi:type I restriction enzyme M protein
MNITQKTKMLVDELKTICADAGLGNDGNEYKIITEVFLYKFMNDRFFWEIRKLGSKYQAASASYLESMLAALSDDEYKRLLQQLPESVARLRREYFLSNLYNKQAGDSFKHGDKEYSDFASYFDATLKAVSIENDDIFSVTTPEGVKIQLFNGISQYIIEPSKKDGFCRAIVGRLVEFNFGEAFEEKHDFYAVIFEHLIKDYNKNGGGKYAEYYTPRAVAKIMSEILVEGEVSNALCYDPSAGTGSLLMSLAHKIGEDRCTIYSQDMSQKSSTLLRMNLILNGLAHSIPNVVQGNTITDPYHLTREKMSFDYIVSNPPFKLDFSEWRDSVDATRDSGGLVSSIHKRFFAGVPSVPNKKKESMAIYLLFIQHAVASLNAKGKAAIVVPTGFLTEGKGKETSIAHKIRKLLVDSGWLKAVVSMPSNIFATTGTNVSVLFIDKGNTGGKAVLVDASGLGTTIKEDKNQKTVLSREEEERIVSAVHGLVDDNGFSVVKTFAEIKEGKYSFNPGGYFDVKIEREDITAEEFAGLVASSESRLKGLFGESKGLEAQIIASLGRLKYE